jgi:hypothetical protein
VVTSWFFHESRGSDFKAAVSPAVAALDESLELLVDLLRQGRRGERFAYPGTRLCCGCGGPIGVRPLSFVLGETVYSYCLQCRRQATQLAR